MSRFSLSVLSGQTGRFFFINAFGAMVFCFFSPLIPTFMVEELGVEPMYIGLFMVATAISGVLYSQLVGRLSDNGVNDKLLYQISMLGSLLFAVSLMVLDGFWQLLIAGVVLLSIARTSMSQSMTMIRKYAERSKLNTTTLNAQMRSSISGVWIIGPPIAFGLAGAFGFRASFLAAAVLAVVVMLVAHYNLPETTSSKKTKQQRQDSEPIPMLFWLLGAITFFAFAAHSIYFTAIPLYLVQEMGAEVSVSGLLLGLTAGLEIPFMLLAARYCARFGVSRLLRWSFVSGFIFYASLQWVESIPSIFMLTIFNGIFFGVFAGLSISLFQDALPDRPGVASAFYSNSMTIASMAGGSIAGLLAQWVDFKFALLGSVVSIVMAFIGLIIYEAIQVKSAETKS